MSASTSPAFGGRSITTSDTENNAEGLGGRAISVLVSGDVSVSNKQGETFTVHVVAGSPFPITNLIRINATNTTATGIVVLY